MPASSLAGASLSAFIFGEDDEPVVVPWSGLADLCLPIPGSEVIEAFEPDDPAGSTWILSMAGSDINESLKLPKGDKRLSAGPNGLTAPSVPPSDG